MKETHFEKTLTELKKQQIAQERQLRALNTVIRILSEFGYDQELIRNSQSGGIEYNVHFIRPAHNKIPIMTVNTSIALAYSEAVRLHDLYNECEHSLAEVFICIEDMLVPILPHDAAQVASDESGKTFSEELFCINPQTIMSVEQIIKPKGHWHSGLHANEPTKAPVERKVLV